MTGRRALLVVVALGIMMGPLTAGAQLAAKVPRVGVLLTYSTGALNDLRQGLRELGYVEGQTVVLEVRSAEERLERLPALAAELVRLRVDVIVTHGPQGVRVAKEATGTIPIVMARMDDVDAHGFVTNLARPGGNITGLSFQTGELAGKWVQLLKEVVPGLSRLAVLWDTKGTGNQLRSAQDAARALGLRVLLLEIQSPAELNAALEAARREKAEALVILGAPFLTAHAERLAELATSHRFPAVYYNRRFAAAGGLLSYGPKESDFTWRRAAGFVDKILKGAKPSDLPIEQPTTFELVVNLRTAKALRVTFPESILVRADEVLR